MLSVNLGALNNIQVPGGKSVLVPLTGMDSNNAALNYSFQSSDPNVTVSLVSPGSKSLVLNVSGTDKNNQAFTGTLVLHLFEDLTPIATARIEQLATQGFYNGKNFFRVLDGFVAQTNGSTGQTFDNEIVSSLTFNSPGLLAMANAGTQNGHGTNDAQFFITAIDNKGNTNPITLAHTPQFLNGNYTLFGQLVSGFDTFEKIMQVAVQTGPNFGSEVSSPVNSITITSAQVIDDTHDAVLRVSAPASFDGHSATITVTATNASNETAHQSFTAAAVVDPPTLGTVTNQTTTATTPVTFTLTSQANDSTAGVTYKIFDATTHAAPAHVTISINQSTGQVTLTPDSGFVGTINLLAGARATTAADSFDNYDTGAVHVDGHSQHRAQTDARQCQQSNDNDGHGRHRHADFDRFRRQRRVLQSGRRHHVWHAGPCHDQHQSGHRPGDDHTGCGVHRHNQPAGWREANRGRG